MTTHLSLQRMLLPTAQVSDLTTGSITLPSARGAYSDTSYDLIETIALESASATVEFTSIPQTYQHLEVRYNAWTDRTANFLDDLNISFGNTTYDTGSNYQWRLWGASGDGARFTLANSNTTFFQSAICIGGNTYKNGIGVFLIENYAQTDVNKGIHGSMAFHTNDASDLNRFGYWDGIWRSTNALERIKFSAANSNINTYSRFSLYGIKGS